MHLSELLPIFATHPSVAALDKVISDHAPALCHLQGLCASSASVVFASLLARKKKCQRNILFILNDEEEAGYFYHDLVQMLGDEKVLFFPSTFRRAVKYAQRDTANEILRTETLEKLSRNATSAFATYVVTFPAALAERVAAKKKMQESTLCIKEGDSFDLSQLISRLIDLGFESKDYVYEAGEFAVRGSILDVFSYASEYPFRIDFLGDEVDSIRTFEVETQLSHERKEEVSIVPDTEVSQEGSLVSFGEYIESDTLLVVKDLAYIHEAVKHIYQKGFSKQAEIAETQEEKWDGNSPVNSKSKGEYPSSASASFFRDKDKILITGDDFLREVASLQRINIGTQPLGTPQTVISFQMRPQYLCHKNFDLLKDSLQQLHEKDFRIYILADNRKQTERLSEIFAGMNCGDHFFIPVEQTLHEGFIDETLRIAFFTDHQVFDRFHKYNLKSDHARDTKMALTLKELRQFQVGDYVVHIDHGIGRFAGLVRMPSADGSLQEMLKLTYKNEDAVYVSIHALHKVSKYKGKDGEAPRISSIGTGAWEKLKERTKKKIKDIARDLIKLYSQRKEEKGFSFSPDSFLQHELEAGFLYEDTPDQLRVTREVKNDMESSRPMDRLVCGDVGFGKTEIAVRAALKAATDNKQVAVLVPTTVLALQHYKTFSSRLKDFPVRVDYLTRARSTAQTSALLRDLEEGKIDILIGTHKLIGKKVKWHDLGLLVIDEEQKFGVAVKEKLRQLKVNVDTLTMSATPIPRTLQFSLMGARDLSILQAPPPNRRPIQTEIHTFNHEIIADAINFEMSRNGQVFIVTNRIAMLENLASLVRKYVPDARVAVGHGQMPPDQLEKIVMGFINYDYDVLISTTIIENGIDVPNANTIIIDAAHHYGLSDLHQMRGRVGRSDRKAFCYLLAPPLAMLPDDARRRLQAIENFSDLGSGIHIAMQDLDIRGAGNLLGAEQSGFIADLGYETYQKILSEAVTELKNDEFADLYVDEMKQTGHLSGEIFVDDCSVECDLHAYFPETYVPGATERMLLYRELDSLTTNEQIETFRRNMEDRFGQMPHEGEELLRIVPLRAMGRKAGAERILLKNNRMTLYFVSNPESAFYKSDTFGQIIRYATNSFKRCKLDEHAGHRRMLISDVPSVEAALTTLHVMLDGKTNE